jgi:hypothetical protein
VAIIRAPSKVVKVTVFEMCDVFSRRFCEPPTRLNGVITIHMYIDRKKENGTRVVCEVLNASIIVNHRTRKCLCVSMTTHMSRWGAKLPKAYFEVTYTVHFEVAYTVHFEVTCTVHHDCTLIDVYQLCALNCISVHIFVFSPARFGAFSAPSSGTFSVSIHTNLSRERTCSWHRGQPAVPQYGNLP